MASNGLLLIRGVGGGGGAPHHLHHQQKQLFSSFPNKSLLLRSSLLRFRNFSTPPSALLPPDVSRLAETARISLTPNEIEEFAPKIRQIIDGFWQLQAVDLQSIEPAVRADTEGDNFRQDLSETFGNREAILAAVPSYEEPYIKVPKVLNKD